jgi:hypothetical protein
MAGRRIWFGATRSATRSARAPRALGTSWFALAIERGLTAEEKAPLTKVIPLLRHVTGCQARSAPPRFRESRETAS